MFSHDPDLWTGCLMYRRIGQVIAPLLIIQRVANKSALTGDTMAAESPDPLKSWGRREMTGGSDTLPGGYP